MPERATKMAYLTVDWDYFIPEDPAWHLGHKENQAHLSAIWSRRDHLRSIMRTNGNELEFWPRLWHRLDPGNHMMVVSDSHLSVWYDPRLHVSQTVILIDAHHDCFMHDGDMNKVHSANWLGCWLQNDRRRRAIWLRASHTWERDLSRADLAQRVATLDQVEHLPKARLTGLHVCRSGCWTPPWLDDAFRRFVAASRHQIVHGSALGNGRGSAHTERVGSTDLVENPLTPRV